MLRYKLKFLLQKVTEVSDQGKKKNRSLLSNEIYLLLQKRTI